MDVNLVISFSTDGGYTIVLEGEPYQVEEAMKVVDATSDIGRLVYKITKNALADVSYHEN